MHADRGEFMPSYPTSPLLFEDECSTECDLHFSDLPNSSPASESSNNLIPDNLDDNVGIRVFEPRQPFSDSDSESILGSAEQFSHIYEDSTDESVNEESRLGEVSNEQFTPVNEEALHTGSRLTKEFFTFTLICFETHTHWCGPL